VALKREARSGVGEWGKQCRGCCFLWSLYTQGYISVVVVEGACQGLQGFGVV
jgi:hypothetical protein